MSLRHIIGTGVNGFERRERKSHEENDRDPVLRVSADGLWHG